MLHPVMAAAVYTLAFVAGARPSEILSKRKTDQLGMKSDIHIGHVRSWSTQGVRDLVLEHSGSVGLGTQFWSTHVFGDVGELLLFLSVYVW